MTEAFFVTGTDTSVGKTIVTAGLVRAFAKLGMRVVGLKPIAAGCEETPDGLRNEDALLLQQASNVELSYEQINPIALARPIAPHLAAAEEGIALEALQLAKDCESVMDSGVDVAFIEGAGGWMVPLNHHETLAEVPRLLATPVVLVVGMRLGCLNHALLTAAAIRQEGLELVGWVANQLDPDMACYTENITTLQHGIQAPLLGDVPYLKDLTADEVAAHLDVSILLQNETSITFH